MNRYQVTLNITAETAIDIEDQIENFFDSTMDHGDAIASVELESIELVEEYEPAEEQQKMSGDYDA